jgi:hypothetical protein
MIEFLTSLLVVITSVYAFLTFRILQANRDSVTAMRAQIDAATRPYVHFDLMLRGPLVEASVRNTGVTAGRNVRVTTAPPLRVAIHNETRPSHLTTACLALLAPGRELREFIGRIEHVRSLTESLSFTACVDYADMSGRHYHDEFAVDLRGLFEMPHIDKPETGRELRTIGETLKEIQHSISKMGGTAEV